MAARELSPALTNASLPCGAQAWAEQAQRTVRLSGRWLPNRTVLLDNRQMAGRPGLFVLTVFELAESVKCPARWLVVQRGWLPRNSHDRSQAPHFVTPSGVVQLSGRLILEPSRSFSLGSELPLSPDVAPQIVQNVDLDALSRQWGLLLRTGAVLQLTDDAPVDGASSAEHAALPLLRQWPVPAADVGKHHAYAVQWFALSALISGLYVWFQLIRPFRQRTQ